MKLGWEEGLRNGETPETTDLVVLGTERRRDQKCLQPSSRVETLISVCERCGDNREADAGSEGHTSRKCLGHGMGVLRAGCVRKSFGVRPAARELHKAG